MISFLIYFLLYSFMVSCCTSLQPLINIRYTLNCNFLPNITALYPRSLKVGRSSFTTLLHPYRQSVLITCKMLYDKLNPWKSSSHFRQKKKLFSYGIEKGKLNKIYLLPFKATEEVKLAIFQHKIIQNILATNSILYKMNKICLPFLPFFPLW